MIKKQAKKSIQATAVFIGLLLCSPAKADEALVLKYSGGKLVYAGVVQNLTFDQSQGFMSFDSKTFGFRDKCSGLIVRLVDDIVLKQSKESIDCDKIPKSEK